MGRRARPFTPQAERYLHGATARYERRLVAESRRIAARWRSEVITLACVRAAAADPAGSPQPRWGDAARAFGGLAAGGGLGRYLEVGAAATARTQDVHVAVVLLIGGTLAMAAAELTRS